MAKPKITRNNQADSESADLVVWTNVSKNPVILSDGSTVGAGEQTTPEQAEFAEGSLWAEHGVLVSGALVITDDGADQISALTVEVEGLRAQLLTVGGEKSALLTEIEELKAKIPKAE